MSLSPRSPKIRSEMMLEVVQEKGVERRDHLHACLRTTREIRTYIKMAGKLGAIARESPLLAVLSLFKRTPSSYLPLKPGICKYPHYRRPLSQLLRMAQQDVQNGSHEVKGPTPKIAKLHEKSDVSGNPTSFFRVKKLAEKAVLPSRGSPLSAGYDLSR